MKEIGKGLQFTVYDLENGRVLKIPNSIDDMKKILIKWNPSLLINSKDLNEKIDYYLVLTEKSMVGIKNSNINLEILGNPIFLDDNKIEQDKVKMISDCLQGEIDNQKKVIDEFIILTIESWKNGFSDIVFNLKINSGIDKNGKAILSDFGELTFDKEIVKSHILEKKWEKSYDFRYRIEKEIKLYYKAEMSSHLTLENLEKYWQLSSQILKNK